MNKPLQIYLPADKLKQLKQLALDRETNVSELVRSRIDLYLLEQGSKGQR